MKYDQDSWIAGYVYAWELFFKGLTKEEIIDYLKLQIEEEAPYTFNMEVENIQYNVQDMMWSIQTDEGQCQFAKDRGWDGVSGDDEDYVAAFYFVCEQEEAKLQARKDEWIAQYIQTLLDELNAMTREQIIEEQMQEIKASAEGRYRLAIGT